MKLIAIAAGTIILCLQAVNTNTFGSRPYKASNIPDSSLLSLVVLGTVQDAGSPQIACAKSCCTALFSHPENSRRVTSLGIFNKITGENFLFEASPDIAAQLKMLKVKAGKNANELPQAIFLTHAHIGHYSGLMYLGKEAANADQLVVYCMPGMKKFLEQNGPWSQLVSNKNISIKLLENETPVAINDQLKIIPVTVPHRDEFSETVGYRIIGPHKKILFIPDIDKWSKWHHDIVKEIANVDVAFVDGTFYNATEIDNRDISTIPHPFVIETMQLLSGLPGKEKNKIHFIHFNHTNPLLRTKSQEARLVNKNGFHIATIGQEISL